MRSSKSGTVLGATLVVAVAITVVLAGMIGWVNTESRTARRNFLLTKAQYGAEATAEYAASQIQCILQQKPTFSDTIFTSNGAITVPTSAVVGSTGSAVLTGVTGTGSVAYNTGIASSLATLQSSATADTARYSVTGSAIKVSSISAASNVTLDPASELYKNDPLRGQKVRVRTLRVLASATATDTQRGETTTAYVEEILQIRDTALVGYISFYNMDFEIASATNMSLVGALHCNRDMYLGALSGKQLDFSGVVTSAGKIYGGRYPTGVSGMSTLSGNVSFGDADGTQVQMKSGSTWIDTTYAGWKDTALTKWDGNVMNAAHGITQTMPASVPPYQPDNPSTGAYDPVNDAHDLIEPSIPNTSSAFAGNDYESAKFSNLASLVLVVTASASGSGESATSTQSYKLYKYVQDSTGTYVRPTADGTALYKRVEIAVPTNLVTKNKMYDRRQSEFVHTADINIGVLKTAIEKAGTAPAFSGVGSNTFVPDSEWNGVLYVEHSNPKLGSGTMGAVRLWNGGSLPNWSKSTNGNAAGLTLASNAPLYIIGHYNSNGSLPSTSATITAVDTNEVPAAIAADAVTVLSSAWTRGTGSTSGTATSDAASNEGLSSMPDAANTEIGAAIMTGIVPSNKQGAGNWSGAFNNVARFLEDWGGKKIGIRGAFSVLYESEVANVSLPTPSTSVFSPPDRWFGLSQDFADGTKTPPGAPRTRTVRRLKFRQLSAAEYQTAIANINSY